MNENAHDHFGAKNRAREGNLRATWGLKKMRVSQGLCLKGLANPVFSATERAGFFNGKIHNFRY